MSTQIPTAFVQQYSSTVRFLVQQKMSRLRGAVDVRTDLTGESAFFEQIGQATTTKKTGRHQKIEFSDTPHKRRMVTSDTYDTADAIDSDDKLKILIADPAGQYAQAQGMALARDMDDVIIEAAHSVAKTGKSGGASTPLPAGQVIDNDYNEGGSPAASDLTIGKLRRAAAILDENEVPPEDRFIATGSRQRHALLATTEVTSADFNTVRALVNGEINTFLGFQFIRTERLKKVGDIREVIAWHRDGIALGEWQPPTTKIDPRVDLKTHPTQVYSWMDLGATRMEEKQVVKIECDETAALTS